MTEDQLIYFTSIVECGSYSETALELDISQSTISKQVAQLETELNVKLFDRSTRKASLTPEGEALYPEAAALLSQIRAIKTHAAALALGGRRKIDIIALPFVGNLNFYVPIFTFEYRLDSCLRLGEFTITEKMLERAVEDFEAQTGADIRDFCATIGEDGEVTVLVENYGSERCFPAPEERSRLMDENLSQLCPAYRGARENRVIPSAKVRILEPETQLLFRDRRMFLEKTAPDQIKPIRVPDTQHNREFFMALSEE